MILYERALRLLPGSYKLWRAYLTVLMEGFKNRDESYYFKVKTQQQGNPAASANSISPKYTSGNFAILRSAFERSLVRMNKYPRIWSLYLAFLTSFPTEITLTRRTFDRALQSLPVTQHDKIWPLYKEWVLEVRMKQKLRTLPRQRCQG